jgi:hypothetical protein
MTESLPTARSGAEIDQFLEQFKTPVPGPSHAPARLIFAIDATASRMPTWDAACHIQGAMFEATAGLGSLDIQLVFYRGFDECKASRWVNTAAALHRAMRGVHCVGGNTQIATVLSHAITETKRSPISALVFVGDAMEESADVLCGLAGELGTLGVPIFVFQEGNLPTATSTLRLLAQLSKGAHLSFDLAAIDRLKQLLAAVAVYAAGGIKALEDYGRKQGGEALRLTHQMEGHRQ